MESIEPGQVFSRSQVGPQPRMPFSRFNQQIYSTSQAGFNSNRIISFDTTMSIREPIDLNLNKAFNPDEFVLPTYEEAIKQVTGHFIYSNPLKIIERFVHIKFLDLS